jgi:hypothetical protein
MLRDVTHEGGLFTARTTPRTETHNTERVTFHAPVSPSIGWWSANRLGRAVDATGAQKLTTGWRLMMAHLILLPLCAATSRHGGACWGRNLRAAPSSTKGARSRSCRALISTRRAATRRDGV